jgi:hypothetical protein
MQIGTIASAVATCLLILALSAGSNTLLDRYHLAAVTPQDVATAPPGTPCMDEDGRWVNWPWPNAPALTLRCADVAPEGKTAPQVERK